MGYAGVRRERFSFLDGEPSPPRRKARAIVDQTGGNMLSNDRSIVNWHDAQLLDCSAYRNRSAKRARWAVERCQKSKRSVHRICSGHRSPETTKADPATSEQQTTP